jgi:hypothetical protein
MKRRSIVRISPPSLVWICQKKKKNSILNEFPRKKECPFQIFTYSTWKKEYQEEETNWKTSLTSLHIYNFVIIISKFKILQYLYPIFQLIFLILLIFC